MIIKSSFPSQPCTAFANNMMGKSLLSSGLTIYKKKKKLLNEKETKLLSACQVGMYDLRTNRRACWSRATAAYRNSETHRITSPGTASVNELTRKLIGTTNSPYHSATQLGETPLTSSCEDRRRVVSLVDEDVWIISRNALGGKCHEAGGPIDPSTALFTAAILQASTME